MLGYRHQRQSMEVVKIGRNQNLQFQSQKDRELKGIVKRLRASKQNLHKLNKVIEKTLRLPVKPGRRMIGRALGFLIPTRLLPSLPESLGKLVAEQSDVLELIESLMRHNINSTQEALQEIAAVAIEKKEELDQLGEDVKRAVAENWDSRQLQEYMAEQAQIVIYEEVATMLDEELNVLTGQEREARKKALLGHLRSNIVVGEELMSLIRKVADSGLQVFHAGVSQFYSYCHFYRPISVIRDSAQVMTDTNESMYVSRDALIATLRVSLDAIDTAIAASMKIPQYSISSPAMKQILEGERKGLEGKLAQLKESQRRSNFPDFKLNPLPAIEAKSEEPGIEGEATNGGTDGNIESQPNPQTV